MVLELGSLIQPEILFPPILFQALTYDSREETSARLLNGRDISTPKKWD